MNNRHRSKKGLFALTLLTALAMATVAVTAVLLGTFTGDEVTIGGLASSAVTYSLDNSTFSTTLEPSSASDSWYTRLEISAGDYSGPVAITWQLEQKEDLTTWTPVSGASTTTDVVLAGTQEDIYASSDGLSTTNYDWSTNVSEAGTYRVVATVDSA